MWRPLEYQRVVGAGLIGKGMILMPEDPDRLRATPGCLPEFHPRGEDSETAHLAAFEEEC